MGIFDSILRKLRLNRSEDMPTKSMPTPNEFLRQSILNHNETCSAVGDWIVFGNGKYKMHGRLSDDDTNDRHVIRFDVEVDIGNERIIQESFVGIAEDINSAIGQAYSNFLAGSFHVLLAGLIGHKCEQVEGESFEAGNRVRVILENGVQIKSSIKLMDTKGVLGWYDAFVDAIMKQKFDDRPHWVRVYVAQNENQIMVTECLLDNEEWQQGISVLSGYNWPFMASFYSVRMFVMIK